MNTIVMSQPHSWKSVRMKLTLPKWGLGSSSGLPKLQSSIVGVKTPCLGVFFISLESYGNVDVENGLVWTIWRSITQVMTKKLGVKLIVFLPTIKSRESTWPRCVQVKCDTLLESSRRELQVCFRPHLNWRSEQKVISSQSAGNPNRDSFETLPWESRDKKPFRCRCRRESCEFKVARGLS